MGIKKRRKNITIGGSTAFTIPSQIEMGEETTLAANRIILADPRGVISETDLLEFLEVKVEPAFWKWLAKKKREERKANEK